jgi:hypothetical protein
MGERTRRMDDELARGARHQTLQGWLAAPYVTTRPRPRLRAVIGTGTAELRQPLGNAITSGLVVGQMLLRPFTSPVIYLYGTRPALDLIGRPPDRPLGPGASAK